MKWSEAWSLVTATVWACHIPLESPQNYLLNASNSLAMQIDCRLQNWRELGTGQEFYFQSFLSPCNRDQTPLTRAPREGQGPSIRYNHNKVDI